MDGAQVTEEVKKETVPVVSIPSREEFGYYNQLVVGGPGNLVLAACRVDGKDRFAIAKSSIVGGRQVVEPLAVILNVSDEVWLRTRSGDLLPVEGSGSRTLLN
jgi:hypothetical protein